MFSLIFMYLIFMIMPDEGFNLFSLLFFVCNLAIVILLLQHMSNTNSIYEITNIFVIYQWLFLILLFILVFVLILENVLFFLIFIYAIYVGAWIVFTVESIRGMYDPYYLVEDIYDLKTNWIKAPNSWSMLMLNLQDICCLNLTGGRNSIFLTPRCISFP